MDLAPPSIHPDIEGAYRRGYHQAIAMVAAVLQRDHPELSERFSNWELNQGMKWRKDQPLNQQFPPPAL